MREHDGHAHVLAGTRALLEARGIGVPAALAEQSASALQGGLSPVFVAVDGWCTGLACLGDPVRPDAARSIAALQQAGWEVLVLSGDHPAVVEVVARQVGIAPDRARGAATPEDKLAFIRALAAEGTAVMIGDGVNDAAALAAATVGIAVRGGAESSLTAADVSLARQGLEPVVELLGGARAIMRSIHLTIGTSLAYNVLAGGLSMAGLISPLLAAFIMPASSLTVVAICLRSGAFKPGRARAGRAGDHPSVGRESCRAAPADAPSDGVPA